jgi:hypothetical protein
VSSGASDWQQYRKLGREAFVAKFPHPFLVCHDWLDAIEDHDEMQFRTATVSHEDLERIRERDLSRALVAPAVKTKRNPYHLIYIGRASNCDIILAHDSVSKLHASLSVKGTDVAEISDVGSRNGTFLGGERLKQGQAAQLRAGDELAIGRIPFQFLDPGRLYELL